MSRFPLRRTAAVAATATLLAMLGAGAAWADDPAPTPTPTPHVSVSVDGDQVTITTDLAAARAACARVDTVRTRLDRLIDRIESDADTAGSAAWLRERSHRATDAGRDDQASMLADRADRRAGWVDELQAAIDRLDRADATVCAALPEADQ